jgi:hypothetical protein
MSTSRWIGMTLLLAASAAGASACGGTGSGGSSGNGGTGGTTTPTGGGGTTSISGGGGTGGVTSTIDTTTSTTTTSDTTSTTTSDTTTTTSDTTTSTTTTSDTTTSSAVCSGDRLFLLGTSAANVMCATFTTMVGWTTSDNPGTGSMERPAVALIDAQKGAGVFFQGPAPGALRAIELVNGQCGTPADIPGIQTKTAPAAAVSNGVVWVLFQGAVGAGTDHPFTTGWMGSSWLGATQVGADVFSPQLPGFTSHGSDMQAVYAGGDDLLYHVPVGGMPFSPMCYPVPGNACEGASKATSPAVTSLDNNAGWLVVYHDKAGGTALRWLVQTGLPVAPSALAGASSSSPVALASTQGGGAVLAFRDAATNVVSTALFDGLAWGPAQALPGNPKTTASPSVARGLCTHTAELVYIDAADGSVKHASLEAGTWSAPASVGGVAMQGVALTSFQ